MSRYVIAAVDDLFFASKIRAVAEHLGLSIEFARSDQAVIDAAQRETPTIIVIDLHSHKFRPLELATRLKEDKQLTSIRLVGFFSHVETQMQVDAKRAGFDQVLPRSAFTNRLAQILKGES
jgi:CheY-like chemotaxis protein